MVGVFLVWPRGRFFFRRIMFTGTIRVKICEAQGLRPTDCSKRHTFGKADEQLLDPYVTIDVDDIHVAKSTAKQKTFDPVWNEMFEHSVENAKALTLTVFHDAAIGPDVFVANCIIPFEALLTREKDETDFWVNFIFINNFDCHRPSHTCQKNKIKCFNQNKLLRKLFFRSIWNRKEDFT